MEKKELLKFSVLAGEIMLRNGAETYRVEDTICRILSSFDGCLCDAFVTPTGIFASIENEKKDDFITLVRRVKNRKINLEKIHEVNTLSRKIVNKEISVEEAFLALKNIESLSNYPKFLHVLSTGLTASFFTIMFQGNFQDFFASFLIGVFLDLMLLYLEKYNLSKFMVDILGGIMVAFFAVFFTSISFGQNLDKIIIGSIMPLVPGVAITNAIRDTIAGDLLSGTSRGLEAFIIALSIAAGVGIFLRIWFISLGGAL